MKKNTQRLDGDHRQHRAGDGESEKKSPAAQQESLQSRFVSAGVEMRNIMRDGNGGHRRQEGEQRHQAAKCAVGVTVVARYL